MTTTLKTLVRPLIALNVKVSNLLDRLLPKVLRLDGNRAFVGDIVPGLLVPDLTVYDLGGGARPSISVEDKARLGLRVIGVDIDPKELAAAPRGAYDLEVAADLTKYIGNGDGDLVICQATLEHVRNGSEAFRAIASCVKPGGVVAIFAPCRNACFARLNRVLPETFKRRLLFAIYPEKGEGHDGFPAFYDKCLPTEVEALAQSHELELVRRQLFWKSSYFYFFVPAFVAWRAWQGLSAMVLGKDAAETYAYVFRRRH